MGKHEKQDSGDTNTTTSTENSGGDRQGGKHRK